MSIGSRVLVLLDKSTAAQDIAAVLSNETLGGSFLHVLTCTVSGSPDAASVDAGTAFWGPAPTDADTAKAIWDAAIAPAIDASGRTQEICHVMGAWQDICGQIRQKARYGDAIIFGRATEDIAHAERIALIEETLMTAGRPVLLLPKNPVIPDRAPTGRILIGWDESDAALAAARAALPILRASTVVEIVAIEPNAASPERSDVGGALARYLSSHGVRCEVLVASRPQGSSVADVLLARAEQADLLVMGGYGHSRLREMVFGGATRDVIRHANCLVLLAR